MTKLKNTNERPNQKVLFNENESTRRLLIKHAQGAAIRYPEMGINPDNFFLFASSEIAGIIARLKRYRAEKSRLTNVRK